VENDSEGENIAGLVVLDLCLLLPAQIDNLRRYISWCPAPDVHKLRGIRVLGQSKVHNYGFDIFLSSAPDHDILKLDIAMHDIFLMQIPQTYQQLVEHPSTLSRLRKAESLQVVVKGPIKQF
jgi:hypothetical protein